MLNEPGETDNNEESKAYETPADAWRTWHTAIKAAMKWEKDWREDAKKASDIYHIREKGKNTAFNILHSNTATILPAVYSATPVPDVRPDQSAMPQDPAIAAISRDDTTAVARVLDAELKQLVGHEYWDNVITAVALDAVLVGRGVVRLQYTAQVDEAQGLIGYQNVYPQHVNWADFLHSPADSWADVWWVGFRHRMNKQQVRSIAPELADKLNYNSGDINVDLEKCKENSIKTDQFARAEVWEIWDKRHQNVVFFAPSFNEGLLSSIEPVFRIAGFFPCPQPLYGVRSANLLPIVPYMLYAELADEMEELTVRMKTLLKAVKANGIVDPRISSALALLGEAEDGELVAAANMKDMDIVTGGNGGDVSKAVWMRPIEQTVRVIAELAAQRERVKQSIYEITGISDIMRGATKADETLGAQQIKSNWGSARISVVKNAMERLVRSLFRMASEIVADNFLVPNITAATGIKLTPSQEQLLRDDVLRTHKIDVETDSTVEPDLQARQQQISTFVSGLGQFITAVAPAIQQGMFPPALAATMVRSFSKTFKLGRDVEDMLDDLSDQAIQMPMMPQQQMGMPPQLQQLPPEMQGGMPNANTPLV